VKLMEPMPGKTLQARTFDVEADLQNDQAKFGVRVMVDREDRTYEKGELLHVTVKSQEDGYLYLLYKQKADGKIKCLFPNLYDSDNRIRGGREINIPTPKQGFRLRCNDPLGDGVLVAIVTREKVAVETLGVRSFGDDVVPDVDGKTLVREINKSFDAEGTSSVGRPQQWAEHSVDVKTVKKGARDRGLVQHRVFVLVVGISEYQDPRIRDLRVCHKDAANMFIALNESRRLTGGIVLVEQRVTRANVQQAFRELKAVSKPGDEIIIYWSGHGGTVADTDGDEPDSIEEFLVCYDTKLDDVQKTAITDDAMGRWIQELDGRKIVVIVDACHSGGAADGKGIDDGLKGGGLLQNADALDADSAEDLLQRLGDGDDGVKAVGNVTIGQPRRRVGGRDFMGKVAQRLQDLGTKDIRAQDATMLLSSRADEISAERRDHTMSVMTYYLVQKLNGSSSLTLEEAYKHVKAEVPKYMKVHFPGRTQTPQLCPKDAAAKVKLK